MILHRLPYIIYRSYSDFGYLTDNRNYGYDTASHSCLKVGDLLLSKVANIFYSVLSNSPQDIETIVSKLYQYYPEVSPSVIREDAIGFYTDLQKKGFIRYIGVSNFHIRHIEKIKRETGITPAINEIYMSPIGTKEEDVKYANDNNIQLMTYSPLMDIAINKVTESHFVDLMKKYNKTLAQIVLRWNVDRGSIPLAKSKNNKRMKDNIDICDLKLTDEEIAFISSLNRNNQILPESRICPGV